MDTNIEAKKVEMEAEKESETTLEAWYGGQMGVKTKAEIEAKMVAVVDATIGVQTEAKVYADMDVKRKVNRC